MCEQPNVARIVQHSEASDHAAAVYVAYREQVQLISRLAHEDTMTRYQLTITKASEGWEAVPDSLQAVARVRTHDGQAFVEEIVLRAPAGRMTIADQELLTDLGVLIGAFSPGAEKLKGAAAGPARRPRALRTAADPAPDAERDAGRPPGLIRTAEDSGKPALLPAERIYRRMPDVRELREVYQERRTITGVAEHFGVPRHTAQGWITRLRRRGIQIGNTVV
jgi:hypothetical protein